MIDIIEFVLAVIGAVVVLILILYAIDESCKWFSNQSIRKKRLIETANYASEQVGVLHKKQKEMEAELRCLHDNFRDYQWDAATKRATKKTK